MAEYLDPDLVAPTYAHTPSDKTHICVHTSFGMIENDISPKASLAYPELYMTGQRQEDFNLKTLLVHACMRACLRAYIPIHAHTYMQACIDERAHTHTCMIHA